MANQSLKQQIIQSMVQKAIQANQQEDSAKIRADFANWQEQQMDPAKIQADFANWQKSQVQAPPIQQKTVNEVKQIPTLEKTIDINDYLTPKTVSGKNVNASAAKSINRESYQRQQQEENMLASGGKKKEVVVPSKIKEEDMIGGGIKQIDTSKYNLPKAQADESIVKSAEDLEKARAWIDPSYKMTKEEEAEAKRIAREGIEKLEKGEDIGGAPVYVGRKRKDMTPEEQEQYDIYKDLELKTSNLGSLAVNTANALYRAGKSLVNQGLETTSRQANANMRAQNDLRNTFGIAPITTTEDLNAVSQAPQDFRDEAAKVDEKILPTIQNAKKQNPIASGAGEFLGNGVMYAATRPIVGAAATAAGLGKFGTFLLNQALQYGQDELLDVQPYILELKNQGYSDEEISELVKEKRKWNFALNVGQDVIPQLPGMVKGVYDKLGADSAIKAAKNIKIPGLDYADDVVESAAKQANEATQNLENLAKQIPVNEAEQAVKPIAEDTANIIEDVAKAEPNKVMAEDIGLNEPKSAADTLWDELKAGEEGDSYKIEEPITSDNTPRVDKILNETPEDVTSPKTKVSEFRTNSMTRNPDAWNSEDLAGLYNEKQFEYLPTDEKTSVKNAVENIKANKDALIDRYTKQADTLGKSKEKKQFYNSQDVDQMHLLIRQLRQQEQLATDEATKQLFAQQRYEITKHLYDATHSSAAVMQAGQKWLHDAEGILDTAEAIRVKRIADIMDDNPKLQNAVNNVSEDIYRRFKELEQSNLLVNMSEAERKEAVRQMINDALNNSEVKRRMGQADIDKLADTLMRTPTAQSVLDGIENAIANVGWIKDETVSKVYDIWSQIENLDPGSKEFYKKSKEIYRLLANDIGGSGTFWDKVDAWRYFSMLANPTTHIRNTLGNLTMQGMTGIKNDIAAGIEAVADRAAKNNGGIQGGRTKAILTHKDGDLIKNSGAYFDNHAFTEFAEGGNRYLSASRGIDDAMATFKTKPLDNVVGGHSDLLSAEDVIAGRLKYQTSLAGFLKANGADASIFEATDDASKELLEKANKYALEMANEATFHTNNASANALSQFTKSLKESDNVAAKALGVMIDTIVPFKKTPLNILKNCFEYSPVEFAKVIMDIGNWKKGKIPTSQMIDNLSKAITGTGGMAIGALLAHEGIIKVTNGNTNKEQAYDKQAGQQAIALSIFGHDIDLSFLPPAVMPLIMGATLLNDYKEKYGDEYSALDVLTGTFTDPEIAANTALESLDTIVDTTMLSGIDDMIQTIRYAENPQDVIKSLAVKTGTNYASQMIPTLVKKTSSVADGQKYSSYSDKTGAAKTFDSSVKYLKTTIPGLQQLGQAMEKSDNKVISSIGDAITAEPKINGWGESVQKEDYGLGVGGRALDQYLNPATTTKNVDDKVTSEIRELSKRMNDDSILDIGNISTAESKFTINKNQYKLNEKQWTEYSKIEGQTARKLAEAYVDSDNWASSDDETRAGILKDMKSFAKAYAQSQVTGEPLSKANQNLADIYLNAGDKGAETLMNHFIGKQILADNGLSSSSKAAEEILANAEQGNFKDAQSQAGLAGKTKEMLTQYDIDSSTNAAKEIQAALAEGDTVKANKIAKDEANYNRACEIAGVTEKSSGTRKAYENGGTVGLREYVKTQALYESHGVEKNSTTDAVYEKYKEKGLDDYAALSEQGLTGFKATDIYESAKTDVSSSELPTLKKFAETYNKIDSSGNGEITQEEFTKYALAQGWSQDQITTNALIYGNWSTIPVLQNGTIVFKRKK